MSAHFASEGVEFERGDRERAWSKGESKGFKNWVKTEKNLGK